MEENYDELLEGCNRDDYVYIIEGCMGTYIDYFEPELEQCECCGETPYIITHGYVEDLITTEIIQIKKQKCKFKQIEYKK